MSENKNSKKVKMIAICTLAIGVMYTTGYINSENQVGSTVNAVQTSNVANVNYKDGVYTGSGTNRFGIVEVQVSVNGGKISNVEITNCTTHYSVNEIEDLPSQVIQRQSANVDFVSGATRSSEDFQNAVQQALEQAKA